MLKENAIKVFLGFISGTILLYFIQDLNFIFISLFQLCFYTIFYTIIDKILFKIKERNGLETDLSARISSSIGKRNETDEDACPIDQTTVKRIEKIKNRR